MELIIILGIWIFIMWATHRIAVKNGRDGGLAIFWSFFFGLLALLIYALAGKKEQPIGTEAKSKETKKDKSFRLTR